MAEFQVLIPVLYPLMLGTSPLFPFKSGPPVHYFPHYREDTAIGPLSSWWVDANGKRFTSLEHSGQNGCSLLTECWNFFLAQLTHWLRSPPPRLSLWTRADGTSPPRDDVCLKCRLVCSLFSPFRAVRFMRAWFPVHGCGAGLVQPVLKPACDDCFRLQYSPLGRRHLPATARRIAKPGPAG